MTKSRLGAILINKYKHKEDKALSTKLIILIIFGLSFAVNLVLSIIHYRSASNKIPENVSDVYDGETYLKWQKYHGELCRASLIGDIISFAVVFTLLATNTHSHLISALGITDNPYLSVLVIIAFQSIVENIISLPISYVKTMKIEEKYGFNRSSMGTFIKDKIIGFVLEIGLCLLISYVMLFSHMWLGNFMVIIFAAVMCVFVLFVNLLFPLLSKVQNKFTPLPDGELRDKLTALLNNHGYTVKSIDVMDASRRTSKSNAYFSGLGKAKKIVLYDNLLETMTDDEICAVFAHELGHGLHRDIPKGLFRSCINMILIALMAWGSVGISAIFTDFGFDAVSYGFAYIILATAGLPFLSLLFGLVNNALSRRAEYRADEQAIEEGYGEALISGLKKLSRENFSHLSPSRIIVALEYSHPPLSERVASIRKKIK